MPLGNFAKEALLLDKPNVSRLEVGIWIDELKIELLNKRWDDLADLHKTDILTDASAGTHPELYSGFLEASLLEWIFQLGIVITYGKKIPVHPVVVVFVRKPPLRSEELCIMPEHRNVHVCNPSIYAHNCLQGQSEYFSTAKSFEERIYPLREESSGNSSSSFWHDTP